ncbi:hypothetical protein H4582DRAFT_1991260 [Lactarius indigo]|nr:hypothetical protein H4582DRAFT_1991260 [Lactarius indigo]
MRLGGGFIGTPSFASRCLLPLSLSLSVLPPTLSAHDHSVACKCNFRLHPSPCWRLFAHPVVSPPTSLTRLHNIQLLPSSSSLPLTSLILSPYLHAFAFSFLQSLTIFSVLLSPAAPSARSSSRPMVIIPFPSLSSHLGEISCPRPLLTSSGHSAHLFPTCDHVSSLSYRVYYSPFVTTSPSHMRPSLPAVPCYCTVTVS